MKRISLYLLLILFSSLILFAQPINKISVLTINDQIINPITAEYIEKGIERAEREGDLAIVIQLDTPGGLLSSTRTVVKKILNSQVPVIVYVAPSGARAGSAGVFITLASHIAAMAPSTNIGAAHPVEFGESPGKKKESFREVIESFKKKQGGEEKEDQKESQDAGRTTHNEPENPMAAKILNDTVAWVSTIAKTRGRNIDWAVRAVTQSISDGEAQALKLGVIDALAQDLPELIEKIDGREVMLASGKKVALATANASLVPIPMTARQRILDVLINPNIAYILMMLGFYGLLFEITHPGTWFPGVAGLICIILAFYAFHTLPTNYAGLALIVLAIALFIAEVFVTSYGLLAMVGIISMLLGSLFLMDSAADFMQLSLKIVLPIVVATGLVTFFLVGLAIRAGRQKSPVGVEGLIDQTATVEQSGRIYVSGEFWEIFSEEPIRPADRVRIVSVEGMKVKVKKLLG
ncbi:MAG: nodulation protein NfeD [Deltaproteobacteria bacterium]|nr:nodulation protein NfeD [Deltaproteobacteria bacterium]